MKKRQNFQRNNFEECFAKEAKLFPDFSMKFS
jgi:hypothetical protein